MDCSQQNPLQQLNLTSGLCVFVSFLLNLIHSVSVAEIHWTHFYFFVHEINLICSVFVPADHFVHSVFVLEIYLIFVLEFHLIQPVLVSEIHPINFVFVSEIYLIHHVLCFYY